MKKCIVVSDSFKGTLSSLEICEIARTSIPRFFPQGEVVTVPVADGGEGTVACFAAALNAQTVTLTVCGPCGEPVQAAYVRSGEKAIIEMAAAAGLPLAGERKDPEKTTTYGVGQLLRHAVEQGAKEILLGLGGSATNDGGCGCAAALGVRFLDGEGKEFIPTGGTLERIASIDVAPARTLLRGVRVTAMCDVDNPLTGPRGAAAVFGPQKGADAEMVARLDRGLRHLDRLIVRELGISVGQTPGAGAAGGFGAACIAFLGGTLCSGIDAVLDMVEFDRLLDGADLVITGEGRIDSQSVHGKAISGIAARTRKKNVPLVAIAGCIAPDAEEAYTLGVTAMFGIDREALSLGEYADRSADCYQRTLEDVLRLLKAGIR